MTNNTEEHEELSQEFIDSLFENGPEITKDEMMRMEEEMSGIARGVSRRLTLVTLTKTMRELCEIGDDNPEVHAHLFDQVEAYYKDAKAALALAESARLKMLIADCRVQAVKRQRGRHSQCSPVYH